MNDIKRRIDEIEAGGVDEQKKLLELESAVAHFETTLHENNEEVANMPPLPPRSPIAAALNFGVQKYTSISVPALAIYACPHNWDRMPRWCRRKQLSSVTTKPVVPTGPMPSVAVCLARALW